MILQLRPQDRVFVEHTFILYSVAITDYAQTPLQADRYNGTFTQWTALLPVLLSRKRLDGETWTARPPGQGFREWERGQYRLLVSEAS